MRAALIPVAMCISFAAPTCLAQAPEKVDFTGAWTFTWEGDAGNTNRAYLTQGAGTFTGTYVNDSKEICPVVGRMSAPTTVSLTIVCPGWEIQAVGSLSNSRFVRGSYKAYEDTVGTFTLTRE